VLPFSVLLWSSFQRFYAVPSVEALGNLTLDPYRFILSYPNLPRTVMNSAVLSLGSATIVMLVTSVICWIVVKTRIRGRWILDNIASLPMVFPGLVLGLSIMIFYLNVDIGVYGTMWIMLIAYVTRFMPYGLRYNTSSMLQIHKELEEASAASGARWLATQRRIMVPLMLPALSAGFILLFIVGVREFTIPLVLYSQDNVVLSVLLWQLFQAGQPAPSAALASIIIAVVLPIIFVARRYLARGALAE
jgi:iron(III) transport system permease protein